MKIGVLGGSFDPIHYGHLILAESARDAMCLDKVIFVPTKVSPFKVGERTTEADHRLTMTKLAVNNNPHFQVSDIEVRNGDVSYTINTLKQLETTFDPYDKLYFITGTDTFLGIERWKQSKELLTKYSYIIGTRPGYKDEELVRHTFYLKKQYNTDIAIVRIPKVDISSTRIRNNIKVNSSIKYLLPEDVEKYIYGNTLYESFPELIRRLRTYVKNNLHENRYIHTMGTVETALSLARVWEASLEKVEIAATFHDACKNLTTDQMNQMIDKYGLDERYKDNGNLAHGKLAACLIEDLFNIADHEIINGINYHTTGRANMSLLEKIVYVADAVEPNRTYREAENLRRLAHKDLDKACLEILNWNINKLEAQNGYIDEDTINAVNWLKRKEIYD